MKLAEKRGEKACMVNYNEHLGLAQEPLDTSHKYLNYTEPEGQITAMLNLEMVIVVAGSQ